MTVTLVTGANKGLGKATAKRLVALGHTVWLGARDPGRGRAAAAEVGARYVALDVTDDASVAAAVEPSRAPTVTSTCSSTTPVSSRAWWGPTTSTSRGPSRSSPSTCSAWSG
ncbi:hypothetical protein Asi02nite_15270 [Asanoa siamensis]|uniref:Short subunit dehydrogenase n=1 Tax=Asanoa siamensis TaxID=926357 RepID=A0ABQ4CL54_9ACTN|nr:hypothetical protein Asi02nite_15270 [Asanoa siamensis]